MPPKIFSAKPVKDQLLLIMKSLSMNNQELKVNYSHANVDSELYTLTLKLIESLEKQGLWDEVIAAYQELMLLKPETTTSIKLGTLLLQQNRTQEALNSYEKALQIQLEPSVVSSELAMMLVRQGLTDKLLSSLGQVLASKPDAARYYHQLGIYLSEQGFINEGIACFRAAEKQPSDGEIYEQIWNGLNGLGVFDESQPYYHKDIHPDEAITYFSQTSQYKVINIAHITGDDQNFLDKAGLSVSYLGLIGLDKVSLEEIYINSFSDYHDFKLTNTGLQGRHYQQALIETGYVYCVCPFTGQIIRTNQSVDCGVGGHIPDITYRFVSREVFYLGCSSWINDKTYIYFPRLDLVILIHCHYGDILFNLNRLKGHLVSCWQQFKSYIENDKPKEVAYLIGWTNNMAHNFWNEAAPVQNLHSSGILNKVDKFLVGGCDYFKFSELFNEIPPNKIIKAKGYSAQDFLKLTFINNYVLVVVKDQFVREEFAQRVYKTSIKRCSQEVLEEVEEAKKRFPLLCFQIRNHARKWLSQVEGMSEIIKALHLDFPNLGIVFDGFSRTEEDSHPSPLIETDRATMELIKGLIPPSVATYSAIGRTVQETMIWGSAVDTFIVPFGAGGLVYLIYSANKSGIVYHNRIGLFNPEVSRLLTANVRENGSPQILVPPDVVCDCDDSPEVRRNYEVDWQFMYNEVLKILRRLNDSKEVPPTNNFFENYSDGDQTE